LLSNAIKFTNRGKICIELDYNQETKNLIFKIIDTGMGIEPEIIKNIGKPYFKTFHNNNDFGIGMGICIIKRHVKFLKGQFKIESKLNQGTVIIIELPYDMENNQKAIKESEIILNKNLERFKSGTNIFEEKPSKLKDKSEEEIQLKIIQENKVNDIREKNINFGITKNIKKNESESKFLNTIEANYKRPIPYYDNLNINNFDQKEIFEEKSNLYIRMFTKEDNFIKSNEENSKIINENNIEDSNFNKISLINRNVNLPRNFGYNICIDNTRRNSLLTNKDLHSPNMKSLYNLKSNRTLVELTNIIHNNNNSSYSLIETPMSKNYNILNNIASEVEKKLSDKDLSPKENNTCKKSEKILYEINSNFKIEEAELEYNSMSNVDSKVSSSRFSNKIDHLENSIKIHLNNEEINFDKKSKFENSMNKNSDFIINNNSNKETINNSNNILILKPKDKKDYDERKFKKSNNNKINEKSESNKNDDNLISTCLINNSKDATVVLDDNFININLNSLKSDLPEKQFFNFNKVFTLPDKDSFLKEHINKNFNFYNEAEDVLNKSNRNLAFKFLNEDQSNNFVIINNDNYLIKEISNDNNNKIDGLYEKNFEKERKDKKTNKILYNNLNIKISDKQADSFISEKEIEKEKFIQTPFLCTKVNETNRSDNSKLILNFKKDTSFIDSSSSRIKPNKTSKEFNKSKNNDISVEINKKSENYENIYTNNLNVTPGFLSQSNKKNNLLKAKINSNQIPKEKFNSIKNTNISEDESRVLNFNNNNENVMRIIVVDDEKLVRRSQIKIITKFLERKKILYEIEECEDGIECLYKIYTGLNEGLKYDVIITDETMNFLKGSFMSKILKKLITDNVIYDIKIFMVTSYEADNYADLQGTILEDIFTKPLSFNKIDKIFNLN